MAEPDVVASDEVAGEFLGAEDGDDRPGRVGDEDHASFDQDVRPGLEPPCAVAMGSTAVTYSSGEERDDRLDVPQCFSSLSAWG